MRSVALKDLEGRISEYVHIAEGGEIVLVTEEDRVVAELVPPRESRLSATLVDTKLAEAIRRGWITPPAQAHRGVPPRMPVAPLAELLRELDEDRGDR